MFGPYLAVGRATEVRLCQAAAPEGRDIGRSADETERGGGRSDGFSLASSGATLAAGIPGDDSAWNNAGAVLLARLYSTDPVSVIPAKTNSHMGRSVALHGDWLLAGGDDHFAGHAGAEG